MVCRNCGKTVESDEVICKNCGKPVCSGDQNRLTSASKKKRKTVLILLTALVLGIAVLAFVSFKTGVFEMGEPESNKAVKDVLCSSLRDVALGDGDNALVEIIVEHCLFEVQSVDDTEDGICVSVVISNYDAYAALQTISASNDLLTQDQMVREFKSILEDTERQQTECVIVLLQTEGGLEAQFDDITLNECLGGFLLYVDELMQSYSTEEENNA